MVKLIIQGNICALLFCVDIPKWSCILVLGVLYFKSGIEEEKKKKRKEEREDERGEKKKEKKIGRTCEFSFVL